MDRTKVWLYGSNAGNYNITLQTSAGNNRTSSNIVLTASTWTEVDIEDIIDASWGGSGAGTLDPSSVATILITNNSGGNSDTRVYGLQFLSSEHSTENFIPQSLIVDDHTVNAGQYGTLSMGQGEKARLYNLRVDGHLWMDNAEITFLDLWGAGLQGLGTWQTQFTETDSSFIQEGLTDADNFWTIDDGSWELRNTIIDHIEAKGGAGVHIHDVNVSNMSSCDVLDTGVITIEADNIHYIYASETASYCSDCPVAPGGNVAIHLMDGYMYDDLGTWEFTDIYLRNTTRWYWHTTRTVKHSNTSTESANDGDFYISVGVILVYHNISFNGTLITVNTVGVGLPITVNNGTWDVTYSSGGTALDKANAIDVDLCLDNPEPIDYPNMLA
jgi:hypothetical protein